MVLDRFNCARRVNVDFHQPKGVTDPSDRAPPAAAPRDGKLALLRRASRNSSLPGTPVDFLTDSALYPLLPSFESVFATEFRAVAPRPGGLSSTALPASLGAREVRHPSVVPRFTWNGMEADGEQRVQALWRSGTLAQGRDAGRSVHFQCGNRTGEGVSHPGTGQGFPPF